MEDVVSMAVMPRAVRPKDDGASKKPNCDTRVMMIKGKIVPER